MVRFPYYVNLFKRMDDKVEYRLDRLQARAPSIRLSGVNHRPTAHDAWRNRAARLADAAFVLTDFTA
jgi:hypothetical protein